MIAWLAGSALTMAFGGNPLGFALGNVGRDLKAAWSWITHASFWQLIALALGIWMVVVQLSWADARHDRDSYKSQRDYYKTAIDKADEAIRKADATIAALTKDIKDRNDAENRRIADDAGALRVSGPGKAACHAPPAASSGHEQAPAKPNAPGPALPPDDRAGVPWIWLTDRGQEHDQLRAEVQSWREWYGQLVKNWPNPNGATK